MPRRRPGSASARRRARSARGLGGSPPAVTALGRIRAAYERQAYGGRDQQVAADDVASVIAAMRDAAPFPARLRADLVPRSLLRARPWARIGPLRPVAPRP